MRHSARDDRGRDDRLKDERIYHNPEYFESSFETQLALAGVIIHPADFEEGCD
jgi:hypothetical protein